MSIDCRNGHIIFKCDPCHAMYDSGVRESHPPSQPSEMPGGIRKEPAGAGEPCVRAADNRPELAQSPDPTNVGRSHRGLPPSDLREGRRK